MSGPWAVTAVTVLLIALSAFFVAAEFALLAAKRHRLLDLAASSAAARAALRSHDELTVLLAGCQLGITACALGLGAITKPAVKYALAPVIDAVGAADWLVTGASFVLALIVVTFLHLVVGEMAPKSWAIAHPERAAVWLALPMRGFLVVFRPLLVLLNDVANACLRRVGVTPADSIHAGQTPDDLAQLVAHSAEAGSLGGEHSAPLARALALRDVTLGDVVTPGRGLTAVLVDQDVAAVREAARASGHLRILVRPAPGVVPDGVVHVRDTLATDAGAPLAPFVRRVPTLSADLTVPEALTRMREGRHHLVLVTTPSGPAVLTLTDLLHRLFPPVPAA